AFKSPATTCRPPEAPAMPGSFQSTSRFRWYETWPMASMKSASGRYQAKAGRVFIKILATGAVLSKGISPGAQQYSDEELRVAVEEATRWGRYVAAHAYGSAGINAALRAGVRTIDHGTMLDGDMRFGIVIDRR